MEMVNSLSRVVNYNLYRNERVKFHVAHFGNTAFSLYVHGGNLKAGAAG